MKNHDESVDINRKDGSATVASALAQLRAQLADVSAKLDAVSYLQVEKLRLERAIQTLEDLSTPGAASVIQPPRAIALDNFLLEALQRLNRPMRLNELAGMAMDAGLVSRVHGGCTVNRALSKSPSMFKKVSYGVYAPAQGLAVETEAPGRPEGGTT